MSGMRLSLIVALVACAGTARAQSDPCTWVTPAQLTKEFGGKPFQAPQKKTAIPVYHGQNPGTRCDFAGSASVQLTVYVDRSPAEAKQTFDGLMGMFFKVESQPSGLGDEAYFDTHHGLHVLKGKTRFFVDVGMSNNAAAEQHARNVALMVLPNA